MANLENSKDSFIERVRNSMQIVNFQSHILNNLSNKNQKSIANKEK
jgi:hypothetical protein